MTTLELVQKNHANKPNPAKDLAVFGAMCAICGTKFTFWFYAIAITVTLVLYFSL